MSETLPNINLRVLPPITDRKLIVVRGRSSLLFEELDQFVVGNLRQFGHDINNPHTLVLAHHRTSPLRTVLGLREEIKKRILVTVGDESTEYQESHAFVRNFWVGDHVKLYTPENASRISYSGRTALEWANGITPNPERVVHAETGYFYPATLNDVAIPETESWLDPSDEGIIIEPFQGKGTASFQADRG